MVGMQGKWVAEWKGWKPVGRWPGGPVAGKSERVITKREERTGAWHGDLLILEINVTVHDVNCQKKMGTRNVVFGCDTADTAQVRWM
jgi:hypothetical protein